MPESRITVDLDDLAESMDRSATDDMLPLLDCKSGEIVYAPDPDTTGQDDDELAQAMRDDPERFLFIPCASTAERYEWMVEFTRSVDEDDIRGRLKEALAGKGAFGRFRNIMDDYDDLREKWFAHRREHLLREATSWLEDEEVAFTAKLRPVSAPREAAAPKPAMQLRVSHVFLLGADGGIVNGKVRRVVRDKSRNPRELFKLLVRDLCATRGLAWRNRFIEGKTEFELDDILISQAEHGVNVDVEVPSSVLSLFGPKG